MSEGLKRSILDQVAARGPMSFAEYMELALYDPAEGFFASAPVGRGGHFVTSPHISGVFAILVAGALHDAWQALEEPDPFTVVELGAGDGTLARGILRAATGRFGAALSYIAVEQSEQARHALQRGGVLAADSIEGALDGPVTGVIFANELLDNIPFHRVVGDRELLVGANGDELIYVEAPIPAEVAAAMSAPASADEHRPSSPAARAHVKAALSHLACGTVLLFDYGFVAGEPVEPIRGYREQRPTVDLLADPGSCDITGPTDFDAIAQEARAAGFEVHGPASQRDALYALGYRGVLDEVRAQQLAAEASGDARRAVELFNARNEAAMLVDPGGLGALKVIGFTSPGLRAPSVFGDLGVGV